MANTVFGPYQATVWVDNTTQGNHTVLNNLETQSGVALNGFNGDLLSAFVYNGLVATKDGTTVNQLDVTAGRAYVTHSDGSRGLIITAASTTGQFTTATPSTTYYLDLNPDGTWSFATAHSGQSNYLTICSVTTDASGNILAVTDARTLNTTLLGGMGNVAGQLTIPPLHGLQLHPITPATADDALLLYDRNGVEGAILAWQQSGAGLAAWDNVNSGFIWQSGTKNGITFPGVIQGNGAGGGGGTYFIANIASTTGDQNNVLEIVDNTAGAISWAIGKQAHANGDFFRILDLTHSATCLTIAPNGVGLIGGVGYGLPTTRYNGTTGIATSVPIYTGYTGGANPSNPPTGSIRIDA